MSAGWKQPPVRQRMPMNCPHLGLVFASLALSLHPTGHEWECGCGQVFVVVSSGGRVKRLVPDWRTPPPPNVPVAADVAGDEAGEVGHA